MPVSPSSPDYACCQSGHHTALLREPFTMRFSGLQVALVIESSVPVVAGFSAPRVEPHLLPSGPPSLSPLRI